MEDRELQWLKKGVWLYFYLLIFEGALRKWVLPELAEPLLIVRDPIAIWLIIRALKGGYWKVNGLVAMIVAVTILAVILALLVGHGNLFVALYGFRITAIHFPLIFVIGAIFNKDDVLKLGKVVLWLSLGMTILVAMQFFSPQSAWVNRGLGGDLAGSGFGGAAGFFRVPGTFSFTNGLSFFYGLVSAFVFYFWLDNKEKKVPQILLIVSTFALLAAVPLTISRTVFFQIALTFAFMLAISGKNPKVVLRIFGLVVVAFCLMLLLQNMAFFQTATYAFTERFTSANEIEGGVEGVLIDRFLGGMYGAVTSDKFQFWGAGLGMGTNAGAHMLTGERGFLITEGEWGRVMGELGVILGFSVILIRGSLVVQMLFKSWNSIQGGNILPWMILSFGIVIILQGQWAQPTNLGFTTLTGGLILASLNKT